MKRRGEIHRLHVPQPRAEPSERPRRIPNRAAARRRRDRRCGSRHRLSPSRRREDGRAPVLAHLHPLHRSHRLSRRRDEQPALCPGGGAACRHRGAGPREGDPSHAGRAVPDQPAIWSSTAPWRRTSAPCRRSSTCSPTASASSRSSRRSAASACTRAWFRIGGVAQDLPQGWDRLVREFIDYLPTRLDEYDKLVMRNRIFKMRTQGVGAYRLDEAIEWGATGPGLRACGLAWDYRKNRPYSGYDQFEFEIPTGSHGDCYDRTALRVEEMRQSLRIIRAVRRRTCRRAATRRGIRWPRRRSKSARCTTSKRSSRIS